MDNVDKEKTASESDIETVDIASQQDDGASAQHQKDVPEAFDEGEGQELFDSYDDEFSEDVPEIKKGNSAKTIFYGGVSMVVLAVAAGAYFMFMSPEPQQKPVAKQLPVTQENEVPALTASNNQQTSEVAPPEKGLLNDIDAINKIAKAGNTSGGMGVDEIIDYGQPPRPTPMSATKNDELQVDAFIQQIKQQAEPIEDASSTEQNDVVITNEAVPEEKEIADFRASFEEDALVESDEETGLPLPSDIETLEENAREIVPVTDDLMMSEQENNKPIENLELEEDMVDKLPQPEPAEIVSEPEPVKEPIVETVEIPKKSSIPVKKVEIEEGKPTDKKQVVKKASSVKSSKPSVKWVLRSAQDGVAWVAPMGGGDMIRLSVGQTHPQIGKITKIAPVNGRWIVQGTLGKIEQ